MAESIHRNGVWVWTAKDKDGKPVESAPGCFKFIFRGPVTETESRACAQGFILNAMRRQVIDSGKEDPGYVVDEVKLEGNSEADMGAFRPPNVKPIAAFSSQEET